MEYENTYVSIWAHGIADGNPSTGRAAQLSAELAGVQADFFDYPKVSRLARSFHQGVTSDPERSLEYIHTSEAERAGFKGKVLGSLSLPEFVVSSLRCRDGREIQWNLAQELPLRSAPAWLLKKLNVVDARVLVPDVYPKETAVDAVNRHDIARMSVWNRDAFEELSAKGVNVELNKPYLLDGFRPESDSFTNEGRTVVTKFSGSGAPASWVADIELALGELDETWALHTPKYRIEDHYYKSEEDFETRMQEFYRDLGGKTRVLIGYPSELTGVVCELRARGVPVWMLTLPPRGMHEYRNLQFAQRHGLVLAELNVSGVAREASIPGLQLMNLSDIKYALNEQPDPELEPDLLGEKTIWE